MARKKIIWLIVLLILAAGGWYAYREYNRSRKDLKDVNADYVLTALQLIREFEAGDSAAQAKYNGEVVEVSGIVKEIEKDEAGYYTIVLGESGTASSVRCSMDTVHKADAASVQQGSSVTIRGACNGFNKDETGLLGSDVILNYGAIINKN